MEDFSIEVKNVEVKPSGFNKVELNFSADLVGVLEHVDSTDIVNAVDKDELLDTIGVDYIKDYFDLVDAE